MVARHSKPSKPKEKHADKRVRRTPEEARALILDAADRVFGKHLPDVVGLKEVAREAGISHALVTHYFGTYTGLVERTLERRFERLRESLVNEIFFVLDPKASVKEVLVAYRKAIAKNAADPVTVRLAVWAMMSGRAKQDDFFAHRVQGLKLLADALEARTNIAREDLEFALVASFAMTVVWTVGGHALSGALGKRRPAGDDEPFEDRVATMIDTYLKRTVR